MVERRARQLTFRGMKRRLATEERRQLQRNLGQWIYSSNTFEATLTNSNKSVLLLTLSAPGTTSVQEKNEMYNPSGFFGVALKTISGSAATVYSGAVIVMNIRPGQTPTDFLGSNSSLPSGNEEGNIDARIEGYFPFVLSNKAGGDGSMLRVPSHLCFGRAGRKTLKPNHSSRMYLVFDRGTPNLSLQISYAARWRQITHEQKDS